MLNLHFSVYYKVFQSTLVFLFFKEFFEHSMNSVHRRVHLSGILSKLGPFTLLEREISYDSVTKRSSISFVKRVLKSYSFQETKASNNSKYLWCCNVHKTNKSHGS